jgi:hypothetical protein
MIGPNLCACGHANGAHDIYEMGDPYPTCCVERCRCGHPGDAVLVRAADGTVTVERADPVIRVTRDLLAEADAAFYDDVTETLTLDTAGEYVYRYLRPDLSDSRVVLFGRLKEEIHAPSTEK